MPVLQASFFHFNHEKNEVRLIKSVIPDSYGFFIMQITMLTQYNDGVPVSLAGQGTLAHTNPTKPTFTIYAGRSQPFTSLKLRVACSTRCINIATSAIIREVFFSRCKNRSTAGHDMYTSMAIPKPIYGVFLIYKILMFAINSQNCSMQIFISKSSFFFL